MNCILFAVYLPSKQKRYVLEEIFEYIKVNDKNAKIFIGVNHNSIYETEDILRKIKGNLDIEVRRVPEHMELNSDACSFITALELYSESDMNFDLAYFIHSKGITSNNDKLRKMCFDEMFDQATVLEKLNDPKVGSYAPYLTLTDAWVDIDLMSCMKRFNPSVCIFPVFEYYYINTLFVIKNFILKNFIHSVSKDLFNTNIIEYSDRYMFERDFEHIVDMQGYIPSFKHFHGNYSTNYVAPIQSKYDEKLSKYIKDIKIKQWKAEYGNQ